MISFNRIKLSNHYFVREEQDQVVLFSGITRYIHFISKESYQFLKIAETQSFNEMSENYCEDEEDKQTLSDFFEELINKEIIIAE